MRILLLLTFISLSALALAAEDEKYKACEKKAYEFYPEPNYSPRFGSSGQRGPGGFDHNYQDAIPTLADNERAKQKRQQFINDCLSKE
jgi:hypothetical protein